MHEHIRVNTRITVTTLFVVGVLCARPAHAQYNGSHTLGDFGVNSGSQPGPGLYAVAFYYRYDTDTVKDSKGTRITFSPSSPASLTIDALAPMVWYVNENKILGGAHYGFMAVVPIANSALQAPFFGFDQTTSTKLADMYVRPLDLGWHTARADVTAGFGFYAPTGTYVPGGNENTGLGMWTSEPFVGTTLFLDEKRTVSVATNAFWEVHGQKKDSTITVGQILNLEGGVGKSYLGGGLVVGAAYYAHWKVTADDLGIARPLPGGGTFDPKLNKDRRFGLGPDVTLPVASKEKLFALVNIRYFWEMGSRVTTQGNALLVSATFPIPSVNIK